MLVLVADCHGRIIQFPLKEEYTEVTVGSLPENLVSLPYKGVSRHHFSLIRQTNGWILKDLGSTNGTRLNGSKVTEATIKPDDSILAGVVEFKVKESETELFLLPPTRENEAFSHKNRTDKFGDIESTLQQNIFSSHKLVFPTGMIPGQSTQMMNIYQQIHSLADSDVHVLFIGETGTGKEMFARMLHASSKRCAGPFIAVNCAAIPSELLEAELFGIGEKVATDVTARKGKMELADDGTLFLDELGAFPVTLQAKVLRALEEKIITRVGEHRGNAIDFRLICAMNEDPKELIQSGKLREDLYHRVATVEILIPPLRERMEDIPQLIVGVLQQISKREHKSVGGISKRLFTALQAYSYPGNVRELVNLLSSIVALAHPGEILDVHLAPGRLLQEGAKLPPDRIFDEDSLDLRQRVDEISKKLITRALNLNNWNMTAAARSLHVTRFGLRKMMKRLGIPLK